MQKDPVVAGKLKAAGGLASLQAKKYKQAARRFSEVMPLMFCPVLLLTPNAVCPHSFCKNTIKMASSKKLMTSTCC